ncbi:MAG: hypothetical protein HOV80_19020 [Polyangiaceae bacterium]|nr:hypothetical protein [Polyangiaceae bacterium]
MILPSPKSCVLATFLISALVAVGCDSQKTPAELAPRLVPWAVEIPTGSSSSRAPFPDRLDDACSFDWVSLDEAFRLCPVFDADEHAWNRRVRISPEKPKVRAGETLRIVVGLGSRDRGTWTAELDDRCGVAMHPLLYDAKGQQLDDSGFWMVPSCPSTRARVTLSGRGEVTTAVTIKAVRRTQERVLVGHRTLPGGKVEEVTELRSKEVPLKPGMYAVELELPTSDGASETVPFEVTGT